jgi:prolyl-tRNA synthetase
VLVVKDGDGVAVAASQIVTELRDAGHRVRLDDRTDISFGRRSVDWELKGVPVRVEIGPRDLAAGEVTVVRRDLREKTSVPVSATVPRVLTALVEAQRGLLQEAQSRMDERTTAVESVDEAADAATSGFATLPWRAVGVEGEARLAEAGVSVRCLQRPDGTLAARDEEPDLVAVVAKAY